MPRETIVAVGAPTDEIKDPRVSVGWSRYGFVQIATAHQGEQGVDGLFLDLDRDGVNRLIRTLRKARDQAFGADA